MNATLNLWVPYAMKLGSYWNELLESPCACDIKFLVFISRRVIYEWNDMTRWNVNCMEWLSASWLCNLECGSGRCYLETVTSSLIWLLVSWPHCLSDGSGIFTSTNFTPTPFLHFAFNHSTSPFSSLHQVRIENKLLSFNPSTSVGFEPTNLGSRSGHVTPRPPMPTVRYVRGCSKLFKNPRFTSVRFYSSYCWPTYFQYF